MPKQERITKKVTSSKRDETIQEAPAKHAETEALKAEMDDILDEIDLVLESNAEEFVNSYVQKGGE